MMKAILTLATLTISLNAGAAPVQLTRPHQSEIKVKVQELLLEVEKPYLCVLRGHAENPGWFSSDYLEVPPITAPSLENAAKLALTPYVVEVVDRNSSVVKVMIKGQGFFVNNVDCKPLQQSI